MKLELAKNRITRLFVLYYKMIRARLIYWFMMVYVIGLGLFWMCLAVQLESRL